MVMMKDFWTLEIHRAPVFLYLSSLVKQQHLASFTFDLKARWIVLKPVGKQWPDIPRIHPFATSNTFSGIAKFMGGVEKEAPGNAPTMI
jgi:hypothetical protein